MASINKSKLAESAQKLLAKGQIDKALKEYEKILQADPGDSGTRLKVGDLKLRLGQKDPAILEYRRVADKFTQGGFYSKAVAVLKRIIAVEPHLLEAHLELASLNQKLSLLSEVVHHYQIAANIHDRRGEKRQAIDILKKVADVGPPNLERKVKVAELYYREGLKDSGFEQFEAALADLDSQSAEIVTLTRRMWKACPDDLRLGRRFAERSLSRGDAKSAAEALEEMCGHVREPDIVELFAEAKLALDLAGEAKALFDEAANLHRVRGNADRAQALTARVIEIASAALDVAGEPADLPGAAPALSSEEPIIAEERPAELLAPGEMTEEHHLEAALSEADVYQKYGKSERAVGILEDLATRYPHRHEGPLRLRTIFEACGDWVSVAIQCRRLARVAEGRGDPDRAARFEDQALEAEMRAQADSDNAPRAGSIESGADDGISLELEAPAAELLAVVPAPDPLEQMPPAELAADADGGDFGDIELVIEGEEDPSAPPVAAPAAGIAPEELELRLDEEPDLAPEPVLLPTSAPSLDEPDLILDDAFDEVPAPLAPAPPPPAPSVADDLGEIAIDLEEAGAEPQAEIEAPRALSVEENLILQEISAEGGGPAEAEGILSSARGDEQPEAIAGTTGADVPEEDRPGGPDRVLALDSHAPGDESEDEIVLLDTPTDEETDGEGALDSYNEPLLEEGEPALARGSAAGDARQEPELESAAAEGLGLDPGFDLREATMDVASDEPTDETSSEFSPDGDALFGDSGFDLRAELDLDGAPQDDVAHATKALSELVSELQQQEENVPSPEDAQTHYDLGIAYKEMGLLDDAIRELKLAARQPGRRVECLAVLGICYCEQGKPEEALGMFEQCLALGGSTGKGAAGIVYEMGLVHEDSGNTSEALECYRRVAEIDPDYRETRARVARLRGGGSDAPRDPSKTGRSKKISYL